MKRPGRPRIRFGYANASIYTEIEAWEKFKKICDEKGWFYSVKLTELIKEFNARLTPKEVICPECGRNCLNLNVLEEHGDRHHREIGGVKLVLRWHKQNFEKIMSEGN